MSGSEHAAVSNLRTHQRQLDADGCEVGVSRQALDEALSLHSEMLKALNNAEMALRYCYDNALPPSDVLRPKVLATGEAIHALIAKATGAA